MPWYVSNIPLANYQKISIKLCSGLNKVPRKEKKISTEIIYKKINDSEEN